MLGPPNSAKSTTAAEIFTHLKRNHVNIELITEQFKPSIYKGVNVLDKNKQLKIFADQMDLELTYLNGGVELIVTDCPVILNVFYAKQLGVSYWGELLEIERQYSAQYPYVNIVLPHKCENHSTVGRLHNVEEAKKVEEDLKIFLRETETEWVSCDPYIIEYVDFIINQKYYEVIL